MLRRHRTCPNNHPQVPLLPEKKPGAGQPGLHPQASSDGLWESSALQLSPPHTQLSPEWQLTSAGATLPRSVLPDRRQMLCYQN